MFELLRRVGFPPFKRHRRTATHHRSAQRALRAAAEPLEARMMLAADPISSSLVQPPATYVASFPLFSALSRGGDALMSHAGLPTVQAKPSRPAATSDAPALAPVARPAPATPAPAAKELVLSYVPGETEPVSAIAAGGVLAATADDAEGEAGDVSITIGDGVFVIYNSNTGGLRVESNKNLSSVEIVSNSGIFTGSPAANLGGSFDVDTDVKIFKLSSFTTGGQPLGFSNISFGPVAKTGLTEQFVRRDLTIQGSLIPNGALSSKTVRVEVFAADLNGNRVRQLAFGQEFELRATVQDVRATAFQTNGNVGVFSAYVDVQWNPQLAEAIGTPIFSDDFSNAKSGTVGAGLLDEVGALSKSNSPTTTSTQLLFRQRMRATSSGTLTFTLNEADVLPQHETLVYGGSAGLGPDQIAFADDDVITITDTPTAPDLVAFAKALTVSGAVMYGAAWCPHCTEQKELFEDGQNFLPFVEVTNPDRTPNDIATQNNITSYPTWVFADGSRLVGQQTLQALATAAKISIPQSNRPFILPIDDATLLSGSPLHVPLDGYDPNGGRLTYTVTSDNPDLVAPQVLTGNRSLVVDVNGFGKMVFELFEDEVPRAVDQITGLAEIGFYNGLTFHRVLNDFVIQGGDPKGDGTGDSDWPNFDDQFDVDLQHNRTGVLSMAKTTDDTNNSQFFITEGAQRHLDFNHTIFGQLVEGEKNRDNISNTAVRPGGIPTISVVMNSVTVINDIENRLLRLTAAQGTSGSANITVTVRDGEGHSTSDTFKVTVRPDTINGGPFLADIPELSTLGNTPLEYQLTDIDAEGDPSKFSGFTDDPNIEISVVESTGEVTITPKEGFVGTAKATVEVTGVRRPNTGDEFDSQEITINVLPNAPVIDLLPVSDTGVSSTDNITNASQLQFQVSGVAAGAVVTVLADGDEIGQATATGSTVTVTTSNLSALGDGTYSITAIQTVDETASDESLPLTLTLDQTAPTSITSTPPTTGISQQLVEYDAEHPEEGDPGFSYSLQAAPAGATINATTGQFNWTPTSDQVGVSQFSIVATDAAGNTRTQNVSIDVTALELMSVRLRLTDTSGNPVSAVATGQPFNLQVLVSDLRGASTELRGVFAAYVDVNYPATLVELNGNIVYGDNFPNGQFGTTGTAGLINDAGAVAENEELGLGEFLLMSIPMVGTQAGVANFSADGADELPLLESLLSGLDDALSEDQIVYSGTQANIVDMTFAADDDFQTQEDQAGVISVLENDIPVPETATLTIIEHSSPNHGTVSVSSDKRQLTYTPNANFHGTDSFTYTIEDDAGDRSTATVNVEVLEVNDNPVANDDSLTVAEDANSTSLDVLANDTRGVDADVTEDLQISNVGTATSGTLTKSADGKSLVYKPNANFSGSETVTYTLSDGRGGTDTAQVTITVTEVNDAPTAVADTRSMNEDTVLTINVADLLANDSAGEAGQTLTVTDVGSASTGSVSLTGTTITFTPPANFAGSATFEYTVRDNGTSNGQADPRTAVGTVTVTVNNVNDPPTAADDTAIAQTGGGKIFIDVLANDTAAPDTGETLTISSVGTGSANGLIAIGSDGRIEYTPADGFAGTETFTYTIDDGNNGEDTATVTVTVQNFVPGGIRGTLYFDVNNDGDVSALESSLAGVKVFLQGVDNQGHEVSLSTVSDANGQYQFATLTPGNYTVTQQQPKFTVDGINKANGSGSTGVVMNGSSFVVDLQASGLGDTQLNFAERSLDPKFTIWSALASGGGEGIHASVHAQDGHEWSRASDAWDGVDVTSIQFNPEMTRVTITIRQNGQTRSVTVPRSDRSRIQVIGQDGQSYLVRIKGSPADFAFQTVTS